MAQRRGALKRGFLVGLLVGVPLGVALAAGLVQRLRAQAEAKWAPVTVLVAARALPVGHVLGPEDLVEAPFPAALATVNCATPATRARFEGRTLRWAVAVGAVVRETDLVFPTPACAARARSAGERLGLADGDALVSSLVSRHGGRP